MLLRLALLARDAGISEALLATLPRPYAAPPPPVPAMSSALVEPRPWPRRRWWGLVALIFGVQLGLIFWLGDASPIRSRARHAAVTRLQLAGSASAELLALKRSHLVRPAAPGGLLRPGLAEIPAPESPSFRMAGAAVSGSLARSTSLAPSSTGSSRRTRSIPASSRHTRARTDAPRACRHWPLARRNRTLRLEGDLAQRRLIAPPAIALPFDTRISSPTASSRWSWTPKAGRSPFTLLLRAAVPGGGPIRPGTSPGRAVRTREPQRAGTALESRRRS